MYHVGNIVQLDVPPLLDSGSYPLVPTRKSLGDDFIVLLVVYRLSHFFVEVTAFVQDESEVVWILARLHLSVDEFLVARVSGVPTVAAVFFSPSPPRHRSMPCSIF